MDILFVVIHKENSGLNIFFIPCNDFSIYSNKNLCFQIFQNGNRKYSTGLPFNWFLLGLPIKKMHQETSSYVTSKLLVLRKNNEGFSCRHFYGFDFRETLLLELKHREPSLLFNSELKISEIDPYIFQMHYLKVNTTDPVGIWIRFTDSISHADKRYATRTPYETY